MRQDTDVTGTVIDFDDAKGWGHVRDDSSSREGGTTERFLHCTAIADGSRSIAVGTRVTYRLVAGRQGRWEAADVRPVS